MSDARRQGDMQGEPSTFCKALIWDEEWFCYASFIDCAPRRDERQRYLALHAPPLVIVQWVRYGTELLRP